MAATIIMDNGGDELEEDWWDVFAFWRLAGVFPWLSWHFEL